MGWADELLREALRLVRQGASLEDWTARVESRVHRENFTIVYVTTSGRDALKPSPSRVVEKIDTAGGECPIYHWRGTYYALIGPAGGSAASLAGVTSDTLDDCRRQAAAAWRAYARTTWQRVIAVEWHTSRRDQYGPFRAPVPPEHTDLDEANASVSLEVERYWLGTRFDGSRVVHDWQAAEPGPTAGRSGGRRFNDAPGVHAPAFHDRPTRHVLAYDEALWTRLVEIRDALSELGRRLGEILLSPERLPRIAATSVSRLLTAEGAPAGAPVPGAELRSGPDAGHVR